MVVLRPTPSKRDAAPYQVPPQTLSQLQQIPWAKEILNDPAFHPMRSYVRDPSPSAPHLVGRYTFMGKTLATSETVAAYQPFYRPASTTDPADMGEVRVLVILGAGGLDGHLHTAHGGVAATLLDEGMGYIGGIHKTPGRSIFTAYMHVDYKAPLPTPSAVVLRATFDAVRSKGRKIYVTATLESGEGKVYAASDGMFLEVERKPRAKM